MKYTIKISKADLRRIEYLTYGNGRRESIEVIVAGEDTPDDWDTITIYSQKRLVIDAPATRL